MAEHGDMDLKRSGRPALRDVAARAGVSVASASNALNSHRRRNEGIGRAVLAAAEEFGCRAEADAPSSWRSAWARLPARIGGEVGSARGERVARRLSERGIMIPP